MAKPINKNMAEIVLKYKTGQYGISELARMYKVDKATISRFINDNNITINQHAKNATEALSFGMAELHTLVESENLSQHFDENEIKNPKKLEILQQDNITLANEVMELVKKNNPQFAKGFQALSSLMIKRSSEILQQDDITSLDIKNISSAVSNMNDTLGVFPKVPTFAQQINLNTKQNEKDKQDSIDIKIEFIKSPNDK